MTTAYIIRPATEGDLAGLERFVQAPERLQHAHVAERDGSIIAFAGLDPAGTPTEPDSPLVRVHLRRTKEDDEADSPGELSQDAIRATVAAATSAGITRLLITVDPMDHHAMRMVEDLGFHPTGTSPYFDLGGGNVQYVSGYQDATGSQIDLAIDL